MLTNIAFRLLRRHKGLAFLAVLYSIYTLGKKLLQEPPHPPATRRRPVTRKR